MTKMTTIQVQKEVLNKLKKAKDYPRQTYNELIEQMTKKYIAQKKDNNYDKFLHEIQKTKMKELWHNKEDEEWERA